MNKTRPHHEETVVDALEPTAQPHPEKSSAISYYQQPEQEPQTTSSQQNTEMDVEQSACRYDSRNTSHAFTPLFQATPNTKQPPELCHSKSPAQPLLPPSPGMQNFLCLPPVQSWCSNFTLWATSPYLGRTEPFHH